MTSMSDRSFLIKRAGFPSRLRWGQPQRVVFTTTVTRPGCELGGPWSIFISTFELAGPEPARFDLRLAEYGSHVAIGQRVQLELETMRNPVTQAEVHPEMVLPEGLVMKHGRLAASKVFRVRDAVEYDHSGRYAAFGRFEYGA
jgi:hypothetical protein